MENETKTCPKCGRTLTADNFYRRGYTGKLKLVTINEIDLNNL